jgi:L-iditol 2-dehydrogenase
MSYDHASMACCGLGPSFGAMQLMGVDCSDTLLVTGLGPIGLGAVVNARFRGAKVIAVEANPYRADLGRELGAAAVIDPRDEDAGAQIKDLTGGGADKAVECSGVGAAAELCIRSVRRKGQVALVGASQEFTLNGWQDVVSQGLTLHGAWHFNLGDAPRLMEVISRSGPELDAMITHTFPMGQVQQAFELQLTGRCGKVVLHPWE